MTEQKLDSIEEKSLECEQYNKRYGTHLSYGYYAAYLKSRSLEPEWLAEIDEKRKREFDRKFNEEFQKVEKAEKAKKSKGKFKSDLCPVGAQV